MQIDERSGCVTDLAFDEWFAGEHELARRQQIEGHLRQCVRCQLRGELLERQRSAFLASAPTLQDHHTLVKQLRAPARPKRWRLPWLTLSLATSAAAVGLLVRLVWPVTDAAERRKGGTELSFYIKHGADVRRGSPEEHVTAGDRLHFVHRGANTRFLALLGRDDAAVSVYYPSGEHAARVAPGEALDFSLELDTRPGDERFFVVLCSEPFLIAPLKAALSHDADLPTPDRCRVERIVLHKGPQP